MTRKVSLLLVIILLVSMLSGIAYASDNLGGSSEYALNSILYGDVNNDTLVNSNDYALVKAYLLNKIVTVPNLDTADLNIDGQTDSMDFMIFKQYILGNISNLPYNSSNNTDKTANEIVKEMGRGWNLGNTMEAVATWLPSDATAMDYERAWGAPTTTKEMINGLKSSGFNSVRIPVAWSNMMSADETYTISEDYFNRVDEIVGYILDNDMYAIINIHWDGGWWEDFGSGDETIRREAMKKYESMWTQISNHYANYSNHLIFESANEELGNSFSESLTQNQCYEKTNEINQKFVDTVRNAGKNNKSRFLLIAGYNTDITATCDNRYMMPQDVIENHLMISVHYYTPPTYCIANEESNSWGYMDSWGSDADKQMMDTYFSKMQKFTDAGYGVIIGEYGVTLKNKNGSWVVKDGTDKYFQSVVSLAEKYGYCAMLWDTGDWYDRTACHFKDQEIASIFSRN